MFQMVETTQAVFQIMQKTLLAIQAAMLGIDIIMSIRLAVQELLDQGLVIQRRVIQQCEHDDMLTIADKTNGMIQTHFSHTSKEEMDYAEQVAHTTQSDGLCGAQVFLREMGSQSSRRMRREREEIPCRTSEMSPGTEGLCSLPESDDMDSCHTRHRDLKLDVTELGRATFKGTSYISMMLVGV